MASNGPPPQSLINAAFQSIHAGAVASSTGGATSVASPFGPVNIIQGYHALFVPAISGVGQSIPRQYPRRPIEVDPRCLSPEFDCDFTNIRDGGIKFHRGDHPYERPCGSYRVALKVVNKFGNDNSWLGMTGNAPGEWPVSYHGTGKHNASSITEEGYQLSQGRRFAYGRGIYSTPELAVALQYATSFEHENTSYKCILQNRVNPNYFTVIPRAQNGVGTYWLSGSVKAVDESEFIRPYGLCLFKM